MLPPWRIRGCPVRIASGCDGCYTPEEDSCRPKYLLLVRFRSINTNNTCRAPFGLVKVLAGSSIRSQLLRISHLAPHGDVPRHQATSRRVIHLVFDGLASF